MGWRTEARETLRRCERQAETARADAQEARALADALPAGIDRDGVLQAARDMDDVAEMLAATARDIRSTLEPK